MKSKKIQLSGYRQDAAQSCSDVDECKINGGTCANGCNNEDGNYSCTCGPDSYKAGNGHCISTQRSFTQPGYHRVRSAKSMDDQDLIVFRAGMQVNLPVEAADRPELLAVNDDATADHAIVDATLSDTDEIHIQKRILLSLLTAWILRPLLSTEYQLR